jgi:hypothetical protein
MITSAKYLASRPSGLRYFARFSCAFDASPEATVSPSDARSMELAKTFEEAAKTFEEAEKAARPNPAL